MKKSRTSALTTMLFLGFSVSCGSKKSDSDDSESSNEEPVPPECETTALVTCSHPEEVANVGVVFPGSLALSVLPQDTGSSALRLEGEDEGDQRNMQEKIAEAESILAGNAETCLPEALGREFNRGDDELCYEFDQDMIYGTTDSDASTVIYRGTLDGTASTGESCLVAFTRNQVSQVVAMVDQALGFGMAALCQTKKDVAGLELPAVGGSIDMKTSLASLMGDRTTVTAATLERLDDETVDGETRPVYKISIAVSVNDVEREVTIVHSPKSEIDDTEYSGTVSTAIKGEFAGPPPGGALLPPPPASSKYHALSIVYSKTITDDVTNVKAELRTAQIAEELFADAFVNNVVNLNVGADFTGTGETEAFGAYTGYAAPNDAVDGITLVAFDMNTDSGEGTLAYWKNPGGRYYENARGFNISITRDDDGVLGGCATTGSASTDFSVGISIRRYLKEAIEDATDTELTLSPKGFWHPFFNSPSASGDDEVGHFYSRTQVDPPQEALWYRPNLEDTASAGVFASNGDGSLITRQCFKQDSSTGVYLIDTNEITETAGFELVDTGNEVNAAKFIGLPPPPQHELPPPPAE